MVTLEDISAIAGVSIKTVSRSLRGEHYVAPATRERVLEIAEGLGYRPNRAARSLRSRRTQEVSLIIWSINPITEVADLYLAKAQALEERLKQAGLPLTIRTVRHDYTAPTYPEDLIAELKADGGLGVAFLPFHLPVLRRCVQELETAGIPTIVLDSATEATDTFDNVAVNRFQGVQEAVRYLYRQGRRHIAYLGADETPSRQRGYEAGLKEAGLEPLYLFVPACHTGEQSFLQGQTAAKNILNLKRRPDAVQAYTDPMAMGFIDGLKTLGVRVPQDVAVVGFDDRRFAMYVSPRLTTVAHPNREVGLAAADILLAKMRGQPRPAAGWSCTIPTHLVVRESA